MLAWAADPEAAVQQPQGKVFIRQGKAMVPVDQPGIAVYPGNRGGTVTAASGGVSVVYADGYQVVLPENSLLVLGGPKQCEAGLARIHFTCGGFLISQVGYDPGTSGQNSGESGVDWWVSSTGKHTLVQGQRGQSA